MIWGDMEGVACIEVWEQVSGGSPMYGECRVLFTEEMNAAVRGARRAGATEVIAVDCHGAGGAWSFKSLVPELLDPGAEWVLGHPWARYVEPLQRGCDAILFVGAHARAGTPDGVLAHTVSSELWYQATINGTPVGESGILAAVAGRWDVPAVFVSGDSATVREVKELLGDNITGVAVKEGLGRFSARSLAPAAARESIEQGVYESLSKRDFPPPYKPDAPIRFRVELAATEGTALYHHREGVSVVGPRAVEATGDDFWQVWDRFWYRS
jgi:D-amino peptidase